MEPQPNTRATIRWSHYEEGLHVIPNVSSGIERVPLENSHTEQLPQLAPGVEELEIAYAEVASAPENQAIIQNAEAVDNKTAAPSKRVWKRVWAGLSVLAVVIVIVVVVAALESRGHRSQLGSNEKATAAATSEPVLSTTAGVTSGPTLSASPGHSNNSSRISRQTSGAYNGTGLCVLRGYGIQIVLFYQHYTGAIRASRLPINGIWLPYDSTQDLLVASDARNGTPMASTFLGVAGITMWQVFYVDSSNKLRDTIHQEGTAVWEPGLLAKADVQVSQATNTGLAALFGSFYADNTANGTGILLFYGGIDNLVHVITWHERNESWTDDFTFPGSNGNAGFSSHSNGFISYLIFVNSVGDQEAWWRDFNPQNQSTSMWSRGSTSNFGLRPNTSVILDEGGYCYAQYINNTFAAMFAEIDNSGLLTLANSTTVGSIEGIPGSGISLFTSSEGNTRETAVSIFVQVNGSDITQVQQLRTGGAWQHNALPIY